MMDRAFIGTELKFLVDISSEGFDMNADPYEIVLSCSGRTKKITKDDIIYDEVEDKHYMLVDTADFCPGTLMAKVIAQVPDTDFPDGYRAEVYKTVLLILK